MVSDELYEELQQDAFRDDIERAVREEKEDLERNGLCPECVYSGIYDPDCGICAGSGEIREVR